MALDSVSLVIKKCRLIWFGLVRHKDTCMQMGCPRKLLWDGVREDMNSFDLDDKTGKIEKES